MGESGLELHIKDAFAEAGLNTGTVSVKVSLQLRVRNFRTTNKGHL